MFLPIGQESFIRLDSDYKNEEVVNVAGNRDRSLIAILTASSIHIFQAQPSVCLCAHIRAPVEVEEKGEFVRAYWQFDGAAIAVSTKKCHLLIFAVSMDQSERSYALREAEESEQTTSRLLLTKSGLPSVTLTLHVVVNLAAPVTCAVALREELFISGANGFSHHLQWNGQVDNGYSFQLSNIPFAHDQLQSKPAFLPSNSFLFIRDCSYAPLCGGFSLVLSDGRAALLTSNDPKFHPNSLLGVWAMHLKDAVVADTNHRFRLLLFGCSNGDVVSYHLDDTSGALIQTFRVALTVKNGPELSGRLGPIRSLRVLPQNGAFAVVWESGGTRDKKNNGINNDKYHQSSPPSASVPPPPSSSPSTSSTSASSSSSLPPVSAVFSPLGSQLWCSLESKEEHGEGTDEATYNSIEWGPEGYQMWMGGTRGASVLNMVRSSAFGNPYMEHSDRVVLIGSQRIYISPLRSREASASSPHSVWSNIEMRPEYLHANWPIRYASLDHTDGRVLVVAGTCGLSFCALSNQRWKIFGNESQERDLHVTGGLFVWSGVMVGACAETKIKLYPIDTRLDERFASTKETDARIISSNLKGDTLVTLDAESRLLLYTLSRDVPNERDGYAKANIERTAEIRIGELIPHIACLVSIHLTVLTYDKATSAVFVPGVDTVLLNVSGRLITLSPKAPTREEPGGHSEDEENRFQLNQPMTIASFVEQVWHDRAIERGLDDRMKDEDFDSMTPNPLRNALWINCGARGSHVWLPLFPGRSRSGTISVHTSSAVHDSFLSKRIMLPFSLEINPALICSSECIATGVESTPTLYGSGGMLTLYTPHRNSEVFIHHLLRQLLKRNLGLFALDLGESFRHLPYFTHSLELLLHNVLEEEATSAEPIPDPLLPRVVAFIQEFPEFLRTVAHCARKTELALWPALFEVTGAPNDLFDVCLRDGQLETAASYLIILQNIESASVSLEQSAQLLREALSSCSWQLARDLVRFARSIDAEDMESSPARSPPPPGTLPFIQGRRQSKSTVVTKGAGTTGDELVLARFQAAGKVNSRMRHSHSISESGGKDNVISRKDSSSISSRKVTKAQSSELSPSSSPPSPTTNSPSNAMLDRMHQLLHEHARGLLEQYCVRDLGCLCSHLEMDAPAMLTMIAQRKDGAKVSSTLHIADFPVALQRVHSQFEWPYPVPSSRVVEQLAKRFAGIRSSSSAACLSEAGSVPDTPTSPISVASKRISRTEDTLMAVSPIEETDESSTEVVALMEKMKPITNGEMNGVRSVSPSASSMRTSGVALEDVASLNGYGSSLQIEPLLGPNEAVKGNQAREAQLRYMIGVFSEIAAMDWVFLLCLVLKDATIARASLSVSTGRHAGVESMIRLRRACRELIDWARANCLGYVHILQVFDGHLSIVCEALGPAHLEESAPVAPPKKELPTTATRPQRAATQVPRNRALREAFVMPGGAVRGRRERSRSVDRTMTLSEETVSNVTPEQSDCSIM